jgi:magnesium-transporting ATPase (P-type)
MYLWSLSFFSLHPFFFFLSLSRLSLPRSNNREKENNKDQRQEKEDPWKNRLVIFSIIISTSISLCYIICGFFFVYKNSQEKKNARREEEELHGLVMTDSFLYNHLHKIWTIWQLEFLLLCFHNLTLFTVKYSSTVNFYIFLWFLTFIYLLCFFVGLDILLFLNLCCFISV